MPSLAALDAPRDQEGRPFDPRTPLSQPAALAVRALIVDPDESVSNASAVHMLRQNGILLDQVVDADEAQRALLDHAYNLLIIDAGALGPAGADLCRRVIEMHALPVLIWTHETNPLDQVSGLELGADDYVEKTAHPLVLLARARAILRRRGRSAATPADLAVGRPHLAPQCWIFDPALHSVSSWRSNKVWLRPGASAMLYTLCSHPGQVVNRDMLAANLKKNKDSVAPRTIDVMISRLRRSLDACDEAGSLVRTARPSGYVLDAGVKETARGLLIQGV